MEIHIGTSGWSYRNWRGSFYPEKLKPTDWLSHYAQHFSTVEINNSFYQLPKASMLESWAARTPPEFIFSVKAWRAITHYRKLQGVEELIETFFAILPALGNKCGPILFQTPPQLSMNAALLKNFIAALPKGYRYVCEFRHPSWFNDAIYSLLAEHNIAFCPYELAKLRSPRVKTADFLYIRLHGREGRYRGDYTEAMLNDWIEWINRQQPLTALYIYFDNTDQYLHALYNAAAMHTLLKSKSVIAANDYAV